MNHVSGAAGNSYATSPGNKHVLEFVPPMPPAFWGSVTFNYQNGKLTAVEIKETVKA